MGVALNALGGAMVSVGAVAEHWMCLLVTVWLALVSCALWHRTRINELERRRDRLLLAEFEAYARFDASFAPGADARSLARRVCRMVSDESSFRRSALLLRDLEGRLYIAGSAGMDDLSVEALASWGSQMGLATEAGPMDNWPGESGAGARVGAKSFLLDLPPYDDLQRLPARRTRLADIQGRAILLPLRSAAGGMSGALAVSADAAMAAGAPTLEEAIPPLEALAAKLGQAIESAARTEGLLRAARLVGLGELGGRVAHELNNPLTAVLGFAELIAETAGEARVRDDAHTIVTEALRMRDIIENLKNLENLVRPDALAAGGAAEIAAGLGVLPLPLLKS